MKLIRKLGTRINKNGTPESWGVFECSIDNVEVERRLSNGYKDKSCGCANKGSYKHGGKGTKLYYVWSGIKDRCNNPNHKYYKDYGGRGIAICPEWTNDYVKFRDWSLNNGYQEGLILDRKNPDDNYEPSNCRFITVLESNRNKTNTITLKIANEIRVLYTTGNYTQKQLSEKYNVRHQTISAIINNKIWVN